MTWRIASIWKHIDELWSEYQTFVSGRRGARLLSPLSRFEGNPFADWQIRARYAPDAETTSGAAVDLEFPGVGTTLLPAKQAPDFGLVDWLVEDAVRQADTALLDAMVAPSPLGKSSGEIWVAPAGGRERSGYSYLPKLARAYAELGLGDEGRTLSFGDRLHDLIQRLEETLEPDVVLLDSRAGLHDIAALTVTRMQATSLLFAIDSPQTWQAYKALFEAWHSHFDWAQHFRDNLKMVAAQIPETETGKYLASFRQNSYDLFQKYLYEETPPGETADFNFALDDPEAPHTPFRIHWSRTFQQFNPVEDPEAITDQQITAAFGDFLRCVGRLLLDEDLQRATFHEIAGPWMGTNRKRGFPYTWLPNHLGDAAEQVSPRSFLWTLRHAAEDTVSESWPHALHYEGMKRGVQEASRIRVNEVKEDFFWISTVMEPLRGLAVPCQFAEIGKRWKKKDVLKHLRKATGDEGLLPKRLEQGHAGLRDDLLDLALFSLQKDGRINMPDVYRVGFGLGRKGGVKPIR